MDTLYWLLNIETFSKWNVFNIFKTISICNFRAFLNGTNAFDFFCDSYCSCFLWLILFLLAKGHKNGAFFIFLILCHDFPENSLERELWYLISHPKLYAWQNSCSWVNCPRGSWPIRLQIPESPISQKWVKRAANWLTLVWHGWKCSKY